jgi:tetratricopeptide (TPR) repeat protein
MTLNIYDTCPCGSGKKIKFCKCHEYLPEMDKITRMIEGEQYVAALDQINSQLKSLPSEPWLLALKCQVLLRLGEIESLEEASAKFIRLQPDNPLAKLNRAMVALVRGSLEEAATLYLQAINVPTLEPSTLLLTVISNLIDMLTKFGHPLAAYMHLELAVDRFEGIEHVTARLSANLIQNTAINLLCRDTIPSPPECDETDYAERFREAIAMMYSGDVPHAKIKLEGIQREFGAQAAILIALLHCRLLLVDNSGAAETCLRLVNDQSLSTEQRAYYFALATELNAPKAGAASVAHVTEYTLDDEAAVEAKMNTSSEIFVIADEEAKTYVQQIVREEVPPRLVGDIRIAMDGGSVAVLGPSKSIGMLAIFGKQTDKPARLLLLYNSGILDSRQANIASILEGLGLQGATPSRDDRNDSSYLGALSSPVSVKPMDQVPEGEIPSGDQLAEFVRDSRISELKQAKFSAFNGKTFEEAAKDAAYKVECTGLLLHYVASGQSGLRSQDYRQAHDEFGLPQPKLPTDADGFDLVGAANYYWADLKNLSPMELVGLVRSAMQRHHTEVFQEYLEALNSLPPDNELATEIDLLKRQLSLSLSKSYEERLALTEQYYDALRAAEQPAGEVGIAWFQLLSALRRQEEASNVLRRVVSENQNDPVVREFVYMLNMQVEQMRRSGGQGANPAALQSGLFRRAADQARQDAPTPASQESGSGLWTPDQGAPKSAPSESKGGSGLWIPGQ